MVVSILIAFGLDAWWDERVIARETAQDLAAVQDELRSVAEELRRQQAVMARTFESGFALVGLLEAQSDHGVVEVTDTLVFWATRSAPTLNVSIGSIEALLASGRLGDVDDPDGRRALASFRGTLDDVIEDQALGRELGLNLQRDVGDLLDFSAVDCVGRRLPVDTGWNPTVETASFSEVAFPNSIAIRNALRLKHVWYEAATRQAADAESEVARILDLIGRLLVD